MKVKYILLVLLGLLLLVLAGCSGECKQDTDCSKAHFRSSCIDKSCVYSPIPNVCGNEICEVGENTCTCDVDCGFCEGNEGILVKQCINNQCILDIPQDILELKSFTKSLTNLGNQFKIDGTYGQPFNLKKDVFEVMLTLNAFGRDVTDIEVKKIIILGSLDKQQIELASRTINKHLLNKEAQIVEQIPLNVISSSESGTLTNVLLKIEYDYIAKGITKSTSIQHSLRGITFSWVKPDITYSCPTCDDKNVGTRDVCNAGTNYFCEYIPLPDVCGNFVCDEGENKCTCATDCGSCEGNAGKYVKNQCLDNTCATISKEFSAEPLSLFDDRNLNVFRLQNNYKFTKPFNIKKDKFVVDLNLFSTQEGVSSVKITKIRLLEGTKELGVLDANQVLGGTTVSLEIPVTDIGIAEDEKSVTLLIFYDYVQNSAVKQGNFNKALGKITFINPT
jgi:hypothetical protein